jgi:transaldolase/glucose-6-phosphate isomerase
MNSILKLKEFGQSCWLDNLTRGKITGGELQRRVTQEGVRGVTSNPAIFSKAISQGTEYDEQVGQLVLENRPLQEIYEAVVVKDIQDACDILRPVYDGSDGEDGFVSLEVSPYLAHDAKGTLHEARHLFAAVRRPNCLIKIPGTPPCVPVIEQCLFEGININITLLFSIESYEAVALAYIKALERRCAEDKPVRRVASVASFFLSRIDVLVDQLLGNRIVPQGPATEVRPELLFGKAAVASARLAYQSFRRIFSGDRWQALAAKGARVQKPLWASTSTKDPLYSDIAYVQPLIGPHTINTMPEETIAAFADHGVCEQNTIEEGIEEARRIPGDLASVGVDLGFVTRQLVEEGVQKFIDPFDKLMKILAGKREQLLAEKRGLQRVIPGASKAELASALNSLNSKQFVRRLASKDAYLWTSDPGVATSIRDRLGWVDCPDKFKGSLEEIKNFATKVQAAEFKHVVLAGMGGSSLCPEVCRQTFGPLPGWPELIVLDNTDPASVRKVKSEIEPARTLFVVASKSGTTTETTCFYRYFYQHLKQRIGAGNAGAHFVAITDRGTPLAKEAGQKGFLRLFENPPDIGGRYSALSYFGLVPMALTGIDTGRILESAHQMALSCGVSVPAEANPAVSLGSFLAVNHRQGRDKVTFVLSESIQSLGAWIEQLLAESTGKQGAGLVPIEGEGLGTPDVYGKDRVFICVGTPEDRNQRTGRRLAALEAAGFPVVHIEIKDKYALGGEFLRWELATATAAAVLGVNAFDEPNVAESKSNTRQLLGEWVQKGSLDEGEPLLLENGLSVYADTEARWLPQRHWNSFKEFLNSFLTLARPPDYIALLAYLAATPSRTRKLQSVRLRLRDRLQLATALGYGPRYLHSTGQLHKGGSGNGVFIMVTADAGRDLPIPGEKYGFAVLQRAQALGDYRALSTGGRRAIRIHLGRDIDKGLARLIDAVA